jgi:hypothetical protein
MNTYQNRRSGPQDEMPVALTAGVLKAFAAVDKKSTNQ